MNKEKFINTLFSKTSTPLLLIFATLSLFTLSLFILNSYWGYRHEIENSMNDNNVLAMALELYTETQFKNADLALKEIDTILSIADHKNEADFLRLSRLLDSMRERYDGIESLGVSDSEGKIVANTNWEEAKHINIKDRQYFIDQKKTTLDNLVFSEPVISRATGNKVVIISRKRSHRPGQFNGIVLASLNLKKLIETFSSIGVLGPGGSLALISDNRSLLARFPYRNDQIGIHVPINPQFEPFIKSGHTSATIMTRSVIDQISRIYTFRKLKNYPLTVVVGKNKEKILKNWQNFTFTTGSIGFLFSMCILFALYRYFKNLYSIEKQKIMLLNSSKIASMGAMAAGIAHEINNPLTIVSGKSMKILSDIERDSTLEPEKIKKDAQKIHEVCFRIAKVVQGLKLLSLDSGTDELKDNFLNEVLNAALDLSRERMKNEGVKITADIIEGISVHCKFNQLSQVFLNLINYCLESIKNHPEKWIHIETLKISDKMIQISLTDSGPGLSPELVAQINAPIFIMKASEQSIGFDLSVAKTIIEGHGGEFFVDKSCPSTCFVIRLYLV